MYWCLGMQASASTWIYNVALDVARVLFPEQPVKGFFIAYQGGLRQLEGCTALPVLKSHGVDHATGAGLSQTVRAILVSVRDPRDSVASLMRYHNKPFREALQEVEYAAMTCARFASDKRATTLRYETGFTEDRATIDKIAAIFEKPLNPSLREEMFQKSRREAIEKLISNLEDRPTAKRAGDDVYDAERQWHKLHANRTGAVGKWRSILTERQVARIELRLQNWMADFGYEPSIMPRLLDRVVNLVDRMRAA